MMKRYSLNDIQFETEADFGTVGILSDHSKLISIVSELSLGGMECFSIISDWFQHYPTNTVDNNKINDINFKNSMMKDLKEKVNFEILLYQLNSGLSDQTYHNSIDEINQLSLLLWQMIKSDLETYKMYRSFFLEIITYHYIQRRYIISETMVFHEPKMLVEQYPLIEKYEQEFSIGSYSPKNIKIDFMFKMTNSVEGLFAFECKADMNYFNQSLHGETDRGESAKRKLYYLECVKNFMLNKIQETSNGFYVAFTTFGDFPENFLFRGTNFSVDAHIIKAADMSKFIFS